MSPHGAGVPVEGLLLSAARVGTALPLAHRGPGCVYGAAGTVEYVFDDQAPGTSSSGVRSRD